MKKFLFAIVVSLAMIVGSIQSYADNSEEVIIGVLGGVIGGLVIGEILEKPHHRHRHRVYEERIIRECRVYWVKYYDYRYDVWVTEPVQECR